MQMTFPRYGAIITFLIFAALLTGCNGDDPYANNTAASNSPVTRSNGDAARTDVEDLSLLIRVPFKPDDLVWKASADKKKIVAVFRFDPEDTPKLLAEIGGSAAGEAVNVDVEPWYPDELATQGEFSSEGRVSGKAYQATPFYQDPYKNGRVIQIDNTDFFVVEITSN